MKGSYSTVKGGRIPGPELRVAPTHSASDEGSCFLAHLDSKHLLLGTPKFGVFVAFRPPVRYPFRRNTPVFPRYCLA